MEDLQKIKEQLEFIKQYIEKECVWDEHLQGYVFNLPKGKVRTLMIKLKEMDKND